MIISEILRSMRSIMINISSNLRQSLISTFEILSRYYIWWNIHMGVLSPVHRVSKWFHTTKRQNSSIWEPKQDICHHFCNWMSWICNFLLKTTQDHLGPSPGAIGSTWFCLKPPFLAPWKTDQIGCSKSFGVSKWHNSCISCPILACSISKWPYRLSP